MEKVDLDEAAGIVVVSVRPTRGARERCGHCGRRSSRYDQGEGRRRWRALDVGELRCYLEATAPRVRCPRHGVTVAQVSWARHRAGHTRAFDHTVAWLAVQCSKQAVTELLRIAWRSVGAIVARVQADRRRIDAEVNHGPSNGLIESTNTKIRLLTRIAFGFRSPPALIALALLALGGHRPALPGRKCPRIGQPEMSEV